MQTALFEVIWRTSAVYVVLFVALRLLGKRELGQFTPFDMILLLTLSNAVQNAMVGDNSSLAAGIAAALTLLLLNFVLTMILSRNNRTRRWVEGTPVVLVRHGKVEWRTLRNENLDLDGLKTALRQHGVSSIDQAELVMLEIDGTISVIGGRALKSKRRRGRHG